MVNVILYQIRILRRTTQYIEKTAVSHLSEALESFLLHKEWEALVNNQFCSGCITINLLLRVTNS